MAMFHSYVKLPDGKYPTLFMYPKSGMFTSKYRKRLQDIYMYVKRTINYRYTPVADTLKDHGCICTPTIPMELVVMIPFNQHCG